VSISSNNLISIIVPVFKVPQYLYRCVESIIGQTYDNLEIILVDDGSPDNCPEMCDSWAKKDSRIKVIHKKNGGLSDARNAGLEIAAGELIGFVDSDDWIAPEMYERLKKALDNDQSDISACTVEMVWEDGTPNSFLTVQENCTLERTEAQLALMQESKLKQPVWYKLYKRSVIAGIPFEKGKQHEDVYWSYQVVGNAERVSVIDYIGYFYWQRSDSIMGNNYSLKRLDAIEAIEQRYSYIAKEFPELEIEAKRSIIESCIYHGQMALKNLNKEDQDKVFKFLSTVIKKYPLEKKEYMDVKFTHRLWLTIAQKSLKRACKIKHLFGVGE